MSVLILHSRGRASDIAKSINDKFGDDEIEIDIVLRKWKGRDVHDICNVCAKPVLSTDKYVCEGFLTAERLIHEKCQKQQNVEVKQKS